jgi:hypothetical protein
MAQAFSTSSGQTLINPGTYVDINVKPGAGALGLAGIVTLIGEADEGQAWTAESDLSLVAFSPDQYGDVVAKFGSGRIVDAFKAITAPANDPQIGGSVSFVRIVKTNASATASAILSRSGFGAYAVLSARRAGAPGNMIKFKSAVSKAEIAPTSGSFSYCPASTGTVSLGIRINGASPSSVTITAKESPAILRSAMESIPEGILIKGAVQKNIIPLAALTLVATAVSASVFSVTLQAGNLWANSPAEGDTVVIPAVSDYSAAQDSTIAGLAAANAGSYIATSVTNTLASATIVMKRISAGSCVSASGSTAVDKTDMIAWSPMEIKNMTGMDRGSLVGVDGTYSVTANSGSSVSISLPGGKVFAAQPQAGDIVKLAAALSTAQVGFYSCVSATASAIVLSRVSEDTSGSGSGTAVIAGPVTISNQPFQVLKKEIDGLGKSLAIEGSVEAVFRHSVTTLGAALSNKQLASAQEYIDATTIRRDSVSDTLKSGGSIVLLVGCSQALAQIEIAADRIDLKVNSVVVASMAFSQFKTLADVAAYINSQSTFSASVPAAKFNAINPAQLDKQVAGISSAIAQKPGRLKKDAADWITQVSASGLAVPANQQAAAAGLPEAMAAEQFLAGGAKNGTTSAQATAAIDACEKLDMNFIIPLFSKDSIDDIAASETESSSTYSIDAINAYAKSHVIAMSALKARKNRIAMVSKSATYDLTKEAAGEMSSFRVAMAFQDVKAVSSDGTIKQFQPWMGSVIACGMQAAAGFRGIVKKFANVNGVIKAGNDFDSSSSGETEDALKAGLLIMEKVPTGGFRWISDQMTYSIDNNFVYNSLQAVYLSDLMALVLIDRFDRLIVGQSVAEMSAGAALGLLEAEMFNFLRLKWIAPSDDAVRGFKNAKVKLTGGVMQISVEVKLAGLIYFVPVSMQISQVEQTA